MEKYILTLSCPDKVGIVASVSGFLFENEGFIIESQQFGDPTTSLFFMRTLFSTGEKSPPFDEFKENFAQIASRFKMNWSMRREGDKPRALVMVSKLSHCLNDLLNKTAMGDLRMDIPAIISNHTELEEMANWYKTPFYYFPVTQETKEDQELKILKLIEQLNIDFIILARYMQILTPLIVKKMPGRIINIHHSFLPSFKGAKPYHQAYDRGVKLTGTTAHYVSEELDEGPIIEQEVVRVDHSCTPEDLVAIGQDIESIALCRAVKWHIQQRIFINGSKTVIFR